MIEVYKITTIQTLLLNWLTILILLLDNLFFRFTVKRATEIWATEKWATGKKGQWTFGQPLRKNGQRKIVQLATGKNGNGILGSLFTVNSISLKEGTRSYGHCCHSLCFVSSRKIANVSGE